MKSHPSRIFWELASFCQMKLISTQTQRYTSLLDQLAALLYFWLPNIFLHFMLFWRYDLCFSIWLGHLIHISTLARLLVPVWHYLRLEIRKMPFSFYWCCNPISLWCYFRSETLWTACHNQLRAWWAVRIFLCIVWDLCTVAKLVAAAFLERRCEGLHTWHEGFVSIDLPASKAPEEWSFGSSGSPWLMAPAQAKTELTCSRWEASSSKCQSGCPIEKFSSNMALCTTRWCSIRSWLKWNPEGTYFCHHIGNTPKVSLWALIQDELKPLCDWIWPYAKECGCQIHLSLFHYKTTYCNFSICIEPRLWGRECHNMRKHELANCWSQMARSSASMPLHFQRPCCSLTAMAYPPDLEVQMPPLHSPHHLGPPSLSYLPFDPDPLSQPVHDTQHPHHCHSNLHRYPRCPSACISTYSAPSRSRCSRLQERSSSCRHRCQISYPLFWEFCLNT